MAEGGGHRAAGRAAHVRRGRQEGAVGPVAHANHRREHERALRGRKDILGVGRGLGQVLLAGLRIELGEGLGIAREAEAVVGVRLVPGPPIGAVPDVVGREQTAGPQALAPRHARGIGVPLADHPVGVGPQLRLGAHKPVLVAREAEVLDHLPLHHAGAARVLPVPLHAAEGPGRVRKQPVQRDGLLVVALEPAGQTVARGLVHALEVQGADDEEGLVGQGVVGVIAHHVAALGVLLQHAQQVPRPAPPGVGQAPVRQVDLGGGLELGLGIRRPVASRVHRQHRPFPGLLLVLAHTLANRLEVLSRKLHLELAGSGGLCRIDHGLGPRVGHVEMPHRRMAQRVGVRIARLNALDHVLGQVPLPPL